jgi:hypothetical protein
MVYSSSGTVAIAVFSAVPSQPRPQMRVHHPDGEVVVPQAGVHEALGVIRICRRRDANARHVRERGDEALRVLGRVVIAAAVADHHGERHLELAARHVMSLGGEVEDLVEAHADEVDERDLDYRAHASHRGAGGDAD